MSFSLPTAAHPARELIGDIASLVETLAPANVRKLPSLVEARGLARRAFAADATGAMSRVVLVVLAGDDDRLLVSFGRRMGLRREWNFGNGRPF